jgi:hypothetical protein
MAQVPVALRRRAQARRVSATNQGPPAREAYAGATPGALCYAASLV